MVQNGTLLKQPMHSEGEDRRDRKGKRRRKRSKGRGQLCGHCCGGCLRIGKRKRPSSMCQRKDGADDPLRSPAPLSPVPPPPSPSPPPLLHVHHLPPLFSSSHPSSSSSSSSDHSRSLPAADERRRKDRRRRNTLRDHNHRNTVAIYWRLLTENTTFHGIRDTVQTSSWLRTLWLIIMAFAIIATLIGCALIAWEFNTRPLVVTYGIKEDVNLTLPDIVVCPFNRFNRTFLRSHNVSDQLAQYLELAFPSPAQHPFQYRHYTALIGRMDELETELHALLASMDRTTHNETTKRSAMSFSEFIRRSAIACDAFFADPQTCASAEEIMTSAGKCFRLRGLEQRSDGFGHGQRVILRLPKHLFNPGVNQMLNDGVVVKLAERGKGIDHDMSFVPSGVHAIFPLTATRYEFKNYPPHFKCREDGTGAYSRVWCFEDCFMSQAERHCNCSLAAASRPATPNVCTTSQFFKCVYPKLYNPGFEERIAICKSHCGPPCNFWRFDKTVTYSHFPSEQARHFVNDSAKWEELQNTIILDVYYITLDYTIIRHMLSMTPPSFVAQLGGQMSMWIGGSIISVIQLLIYAISAFYAYLNRGRGAKVPLRGRTLKQLGGTGGGGRNRRRKSGRDEGGRRRGRDNSEELTCMSARV